MAVEFANQVDIQAQIQDILNNSPVGQFSPTGDVSESADGRRSDDAIVHARRMASHRVIDAVASNLAHPYWGELKTDVALTHLQIIPACYGEIGIPLIVPFPTGTAKSGIPKKPDEIEAARENNLGTLTDFFGEEEGDLQLHNEAESGFMAPMACWYSTTNGIFRFTGVSAVVPMVKAGTTDTERDTIADDKIPVTLSATVVRLSVGMLIKEGDNLLNLSGVYAQQGEADLIAIKGGAITVAPIEVARAIQNAQRFR